MEKCGYIVLTFKFRKGKNGWSGYCEELGTAVDGKTLEETENRLKEFVDLHLDSLEDIGEQEKFFKQHHIEVHRVKPRGKITVEMPVNDDVFTSSHLHELSRVAAN